MMQKIVQGLQADFPGTVQAALQGMLPENADTNLVARLISGAEKQDPRMAVGLFQDFGRMDLKALMKDARVPVRCINAAPGAFKYGIPTDAAVNKKYADFDVVVIDGVGHFPMLEKPAEFNEKLRGVLKELGKGK